MRGSGAINPGGRPQGTGVATEIRKLISAQRRAQLVIDLAHGIHPLCRDPETGELRPPVDPVTGQRLTPDQYEVSEARQQAATAMLVAYADGAPASAERVAEDKARELAGERHEPTDQLDVDAMSRGERERWRAALRELERADDGFGTPSSGVPALTAGPAAPAQVHQAALVDED